jgi:hypothetical protein
MTPLKKGLFILFLLLTSFLLKAQDTLSTTYSKFPIKVTIGNHSVGFPLQNLFKASNLNLSIGSELSLNKNKKHQLLIAPSIGFFHNKVIGSSFTLNIDFDYRYTHKKGVFIETGLGIGFLDQFHPRTIYELNIADGTYHEVKDKGTIFSSMGFNLGIGYDFSKKFDSPIRIGINHNFFIQTTYFDLANFPIMPQSTTNFTIAIKFRK